MFLMVMVLKITALLFIFTVLCTYCICAHKVDELQEVIYVTEYELGGEDFYNNFMKRNLSLLVPNICNKWPIHRMFNGDQTLENKLKTIMVLVHSDGQENVERSLFFFEKKSSVGSHYKVNVNDNSGLKQLILLPAMLISCRSLYEDFADSKVVTLSGSKSGTPIRERICTSQDSMLGILKGDAVIQFDDNDQNFNLRNGDLLYLPIDRCIVLTRKNYFIYVKFRWARNSVYDAKVDCGRPSLYELTKNVNHTDEDESAEPYNERHIPDVVLNTGYVMPPVGLGTFRLRNKTYETIKIALKMGYTLFDTAQIYSGDEKLEGFRISSEQEIGRAVEDSSVKREDLFLVTKINSDLMTYMNTLASIKKSLEELKTSYIDLVLVHDFPYSEYCGPTDDCTASPWVCWRALEELQSLGVIRSVGVSNIDAYTLKYLLKSFTKSKVSVVQNWFDPFHQDREVRNICEENNVKYMGYSTLGTMWTDFEWGYKNHNPVLSHPDIIEVSASSILPRTSAILRWAMARNVIIIPSTTNPDHLQKNLESRKQNIGSFNAERIDKLDDFLGNPDDDDWVKPILPGENEETVSKTKDEL